MTPKVILAACPVLLILVTLTASPPSIGARQSETSLSECQRIDRPGQYALTDDLTAAPVDVSVDAELFEAYTGSRSLHQTCIEITTSDVTLECRDHALTGTGEESSSSAGIYIGGSPDAPLSNINVLNCAVMAHQFGLYAGHVDGGTIFNNEIRRSNGTGIYVFGSSNLAVAGNTVEGNDPDGILFIASQDIGVADNVAFYNRMRGITFEGCEGCVASRNESYSNGVLGFAVYGSKDMMVEENTAYDNRYHGFAILHEAGSASFVNNESYENEGAGFFLQGTQNNSYTGNVSHDNGLDGIALLNEANGNTFEDNTLRGNSGYGVFSIDPFDNATFAGNTFDGNILGEIGSGGLEADEWCSYTGFGPEGPCDPVFEGGPNLKDPEALAPTNTSSPGPDEAGIVISNARVVGDPVYYSTMGDLWMSTWADDDRLYLTWGDGTGFSDGYPVGYPAYESSEPVTPTFCEERDVYTLENEGYFPCWLWCNVFECGTENSYSPAPLTDAGVLAVEGPVPNLGHGENISIDVPDGNPFILQDAPGGPLDVTGRNDKPSSLLFVDGRLYLAGHSPAGQPVLGYIAYSDDYGQTWTEVPGSPWDESSNFRVLMFINMGQNYALNQDGYVFALGIGTESAVWTEYTNRSVYLTRVPREAIADYGAYEYFSGLDGDVPQWSPDESDAIPLDTLSTLGQGSAIYHEGTGRYLFMTSATDYLPESGESFGHGGLFEAPQPWGPWTQVGVLCFQPECDDGNYNPLWTDRNAPAGTEPGKYIPGLIAKGAGPNHVYFTIAGGNTHYQLQIGKLEWDTANSADAEVSGSGQIVAAEVVEEDELVTFPRFGDLGMNTWADNDNVYMAFGDGTAGDCFPSCEPQSNCQPPDTNFDLWCATFDCTQACVEQCQITDAGLLELSGEVPNFPGCDTSLSCLVSTNVPGQPTGWTCDPNSRDDKPSSLLALDGKILWSGHVWTHSQEGERVTYGYLAWSEDNGRTWTEVPDSPWHGDARMFQVMMFINMGRGYELNTDGYVYALAIGAEAGWSGQIGYDHFGRVYLARVPRSDIINYHRYEYFSGMNDNEPTWSSIPTEAVPLEGFRSDMQGSAIYHPGVQQYVYLTSPPGHLYVAPQPWGPWRQIANDLFPGALLEPRYGEYGYIPGILAKGTEPDAFWFTITGPYETKYNLRIGKIRLQLE